MELVDVPQFVAEFPNGLPEHLELQPAEIELLPGQCPVCYKMFDTERQLLWHVNYWHMHDVIFTCESCQMPIIVYRNFLRHLNRPGCLN